MEEEMTIQTKIPNKPIKKNFELLNTNLVAIILSFIELKELRKFLFICNKFQKSIHKYILEKIYIDNNKGKLGKPIKVFKNFYYSYIHLLDETLRNYLLETIIPSTKSNELFFHLIANNDLNLNEFLNNKDNEIRECYRKSLINIIPYHFHNSLMRKKLTKINLNNISLGPIATDIIANLLHIISFDTKIIYVGLQKTYLDKETINELFKNISNLSSHRQDLIIDLSNNVFDYNIINVIINLLEKTYFVKVHLDSSCKGNMKNQKFKSLTNIIFKN